MRGVDEVFFFPEGEENSKIEMVTERVCDLTTTIPKNVAKDFDHR